jgi:hypothetical protein
MIDEVSSADREYSLGIARIDRAWTKGNVRALEQDGLLEIAVFGSNLR